MKEHEKRIRNRAAEEGAFRTSVIKKDDLRALLADLDAMRGALGKVAAIQNQMFGQDWDEIEDDLRITRAILALRPQALAGEREAFEAWFDDYYDKACAEFGGIDCTDPKGIAEDAWQALLQRLRAQPAKEQ